MDLTELKQRIDERFGMDEFFILVNDEGYSSSEIIRFNEVIGLEFQFLGAETDYSRGDESHARMWRFKIGDKVYEIDGWYNSWEGGEMNSIKNFYEVREVEKTVKVWEKI